MILEYRSSVIAVFSNSDKRVLVGERRDNPGSWQFPQGGIEPGESAVLALYREMEEELGCGDFQIITTLRDPVRYEFPADLCSPLKKKYLGQSQTWFLVRFKRGAGPDLAKADREFRAFEWIEPQEALLRIVEFKRAAYQKGMRGLGFDV